MLAYHSVIPLVYSAPIVVSGKRASTSAIWNLWQVIQTNLFMSLMKKIGIGDTLNKLVNGEVAIGG